MGVAFDRPQKHFTWFRPTYTTAVRSRGGKFEKVLPDCCFFCL